MAERVTAVLVGSGAALRLILFLTDNSIITDEAKLAINVLSRSYLDSFHLWTTIKPPRCCLSG